MVLCEMVLCETVLCEMVLCETVQEQFQFDSGFLKNIHYHYLFCFKVGRYIFSQNSVEKGKGVDSPY